MRATQAFEAFGRLGSVKVAAAELGVSIGAVSQQIHKFEECFSTRLFERRGRSIELTKMGRQFHADISAGFVLIRRAQDNLLLARSEASLTISCLPSLAGKWLGSQLFDWQAKHPKANIRLIGDDLEPRLEEGQVDFRISYGDKIKKFEHVVELFTDSAVPACSPSFLLRHPVKEPSDILASPLLDIAWAPDQGTSPSWADWAESVGAPYRRAAGEVAFSLSSAAIDAAINGKGFVLAQISMASDDIASGRLVVPIDQKINLSAPYFLAWDRATMEKPYGAELRSWLTTTAKLQKSKTVV